MYAISLHQPWASFVAAEIKPYETRSWKPPVWLLGKRIAIHAAKKSVPADDREWARRYGIDPIPLGAVVCTAILASVHRADAVPADEFGDYAPGRFAWRLTEIELFDPPVPARGAQGFWKWRALGPSLGPLFAAGA